MDIEFHYYITYLIASRAGFTPAAAQVLAYASQYVDDNDIIHEINKGSEGEYRNYISQTINILKPRPRLFRIYPLFHYIPGEPMAESARRKDGKLHYLNTTPDSPGARAIMKAALQSGDLYRMGIAVHAYVDTWAHQNFIGYFDEMNVLKGVLQHTRVGRIGHAGAGYMPDRVAMVWEDPRLVTPHVRRDNKALFLAAAAALFVLLRKYLQPECPEGVLAKERDSLVKDLADVIGPRDQQNRNVAQRIMRYRKLGQRREYGGALLPTYDEDAWFNDAINEKVRLFRIRGKQVFPRTFRQYIAEQCPIARDIYTWKNSAEYKKTHWFRFQEAVKAHQAEATAILEGTTFSKMELEKW